MMQRVWLIGVLWCLGCSEAASDKRAATDGQYCESGLSIEDDSDCDGVLADEDCDDSNPFLLALAHDLDCDGALSEYDCDDNDKNRSPFAIDLADNGVDEDCDGLDYSCEREGCTGGFLLDGELSIDWMRIEPQTFWMGSPESEVGRDTDEDLHEVTLTSAFGIMRTEVTQKMFKHIAGYNFSYFGPEPFLGDDGQSLCGEDCPVDSISWNEAAFTANALTEIWNLQRGANLQLCYICEGSGVAVSCSNAVDNIYQCTGFRLPTEAEWEYAARSGQRTAIWTPNGGGEIPAGMDTEAGCTTTLALSDGSILSDLVWYCGNNALDETAIDYGTKPVAQKPANDFGLFDMNGNGWEWSHDWHTRNLFYDPVTDPQGVSDGYFKVLRGGHWAEFPDNMRLAGRRSDTPGYGDPYFSMRLVRTIPIIHEQP